MNSLVNILWTIVAPTWDLMSSPINGRFFSMNLLAHAGSEAMNTGMALMNATPASRQASA